MDLLLTKWTKSEPFIIKSGPFIQNSGPFICEGGLSEPTKPPGYGPVTGQKEAACKFTVKYIHIYNHYCNSEYLHITYIMPIFLD